MLPALFVLSCVVLCASFTPVSSDRGAPGFKVDVASRAHDFAMASYCDPNEVSAWNCSWCQEGSKSFKTSIVSYDRGTDTTVFAGVDLDAEQIVVSIRGTRESSIKDWIVDFSILMVQREFGNNTVSVHDGFLKAWEKHEKAVMDAVAQLSNTYPTFSFLYTGHSLGAGMVMIAAADAHFNYGFPIGSLVTFGCPRVGDKTFRDLVENTFNIWRVVNHADPVPHLPPSFIGYLHSGTEIWETLGENGDSDQYVVCDGSGEDPHCSNSVPVYSYTVNDHFEYMDTQWGTCESAVQPRTSFVMFEPIESELVVE